MRKNIPNFLTLLNLFTGCVSLVLTLRGDVVTGAWLIGLAALFDFLDGFMARLLKAYSPIGKQLDSLADIVSFGLVPGAIFFILIEKSLGLQSHDETITAIVPFAGFIITLFSALRLAKFNVDERQEEAFYGLPTPANALLIASFPLILEQQSTLAGLQIGIIHQALLNPFILIVLALLLSWILVVEIRLVSLKFKTFGWKENSSRYLLLIFSALWLLLFQFAGIPLIIFTYIILSVSSKT